MTKALLLFVPGGLVLLALVWLWRRGRAQDVTLSTRWLEAQARRDAHAGAPWEGVCVDWPIDKLRNENGQWNRYDERRRRGAA